MQTKFYNIAYMFFFIGILLSNGQEIENEIYQQKKLDSINQTPKKPLLLSEVKYTAKDCVRINRRKQTHIIQ